MISIINGTKLFGRDTWVPVVFHTQIPEVAVYSLTDHTPVFEVPSVKWAWCTDFITILCRVHDKVTRTRVEPFQLVVVDQDGNAVTARELTLNSEILVGSAISRVIGLRMDHVIGSVAHVACSQAGVVVVDSGMYLRT